LIKIKLLQRKKNGPMKSPENTKNFLMMKDSGNSGMRLSFILDVIPFCPQTPALSMNLIGAMSHLKLS
jgi:hypothetical protein